jgi:hypothetical protein
MDKQRRVKALGYGEQRIEALGQTPHIDFQLKDGSTVRLPHPLRLDDAALARVEAFERGDSLDREPIIDKDGNPAVDPESGQPRTRIIDPPTVDGEPAEPFTVRLMKALLGDEDYEKLRQHGLSAAELRQIWNDMSKPVKAEADPKGS